MAAPRGTTPTFTLKLRNSAIDLGLAGHVYVAFTQASKELRKEGNEIKVDGNTVSVYLRQTETLYFSEDIPVKVQLNWTYPDGSRGATKPAKFVFDEQLIPEVLP